ncbi:uncharacterized protein LOC101684160 isoform X2 [Mustela putorius furo]|uniref:Uncharacterized protein LOC101684160 isoform X2 n=1 Tax=Mustela putorius furo TaxID=9669 RepID=A0A8U0REN6_MUSPF|nr:uncharacterized protein LOC101684160 isoform X2 [Mustela putorius furo]XP_044923301.1 uncharacterized protein LOC101684160 isoform X2 [Mustela putorius furo]
MNEEALWKRQSDPHHESCSHHAGMWPWTVLFGLLSPIPQRSPLMGHCTQPTVRSLDPVYCCDPVSCFQVSENFLTIWKRFRTCSPFWKGLFVFLHSYFQPDPSQEEQEVPSGATKKEQHNQEKSDRESFQRISEPSGRGSGPVLPSGKPDPSSARGKKHRKSRKYQVEPQRRSNTTKKNQTVKVFREFLSHLEEVQDLFSLLERAFRLLTLLFPA